MNKLRKIFRINRIFFNGLIFMFVLILIYLFLNSLITRFAYKPNKLDIASFYRLADSLEGFFVDADIDQNILSEINDSNLFVFNPNTATIEDFQLLGLSEKQIKTIVNYRNKGGQFRTKKDFAKMYCISEQEYNILEPFIDLPNESKNPVYSKKPNNKITKLFNFDPNSCSKEDFINLGLSDKQADVILNYRNKGGRFRNKNDFSKMYCISQQQFEMLEPYIVIDSTLFVKNTNTKKKHFEGTIELNTADTSQLMLLPQMNSFVAQKIITYRNKLGGYHSKEQLLEVYGMKQEIYEAIEKFIIVDISKIDPININYADYKELVVHPYIDNDIATAIVNYRRKNGLFRSIDELTNNKILTRNQFEKIKFYIIVK